jgi:CheY-like chemotaxis protein
VRHACSGSLRPFFHPPCVRIASSPSIDGGREPPDAAKSSLLGVVCRNVALGSRVACTPVVPESEFLERSAAPVILLIEDDEFDRTTLTRMLEESGCSVMTTRRGAAAVDTFALYHRRIALVLASTGLSDVERIRLAEALYRIAPYVPVVMAARRASHRPNSGEDSGRSALFAALIAEVRRRLHESDARSAAQAESFARVQPPPPASVDRMNAERVDLEGVDLERMDLERVDPDSDAVFFPDDPPFAWTGSSRLTPVATLDPRSYLRRLSKARRTRRRRLGRIGIAIAAGFCAPLIVTPLLQMRTTSARAIAEDATITLPPLASASISARIGIVPLVSSAHVKRSPLVDDLADDLGPAPRARSDDAAKKMPAQPQPRRSPGRRSGRR